MLLLQLVVTTTLFCVESKNPDLWVFQFLNRIGYLRIADGTQGGFGLDQETFSNQQQGLSYQVLFLDTSRMINTDIDGNLPNADSGYQHALGFTDRRELARAVIRLLREGVKVIAINVDFSADLNDPGIRNGKEIAYHNEFIFLCDLLSFDPEDPGRTLKVVAALRKYKDELENSGTEKSADASVSQFYTTAKWLARDSKTKELLLDEKTINALANNETTIILGVGRSFFQEERGNWLGYGGNIERMAASITLLNEEMMTPVIYSLIPFEFRLRDKGESLPSISYATAKATGELSEKFDTPSVLGPFVDWKKKVPLGKTRTAHCYYPNYRLRPSIINDVVTLDSYLKFSRPLISSVDPSKTIIFIGDANPEYTPDKIAIPGEGLLLPGVFAHAIGVKTLLTRPLRRIDRGLEYLLNMVIALSAFFLVRAKSFPFISANEGVRFDIRREISAFFCVGAATLLLAWFLSYAWGILWITSLGCILGSGIEMLLSLYFLTGLCPHEKPKSDAGSSADDAKILQAKNPNEESSP